MYMHNLTFHIGKITFSV